MEPTAPSELGKKGGVKPYNEYGEIVRKGNEKKDPLREQRIADGRARFSNWEEKLYLVLGTPRTFRKNGSTEARTDWYGCPKS